jgi:hypothetical protein
MSDFILRRIAPGTWHPTLRSPIAWDQVTFLFEGHVELTGDPAFTDNLLYTLLERPRSVHGTP